MSVTIQLRGDTAANWASSNPVLNQRELGVETDTEKGKLGDGITAWTSLAYWSPGGTSGGGGGSPSGSAGGVLTGTYPNPSGLAATAVTAGSYTNANLTVGTDGRVSAASNGSGGSGGISPPAGDLGGTAGTPTVVATHLSAALPIAQGGTGAATAGAALTALGAAALASPAFAGNPTAATQTTGDSSTRLATTAFVGSAVGALSWNAKLNGLACDDTTDDTTALNTLLATVSAAGGGTIFFPSLARINGQVLLPTTVNGTMLQQAPIRFTGTMPNRPGESESGVTYPAGGLDLRYAGRTDTGCGTTAGSNIVTDASAVSGDYGQIIISPGNLPDRTYIMGVTPGVGYSLSSGARVTNASASFTAGGGKIQALGLGTLEIDHMLLCDQGTSSQPFVLATGTTVHMHDCAVLGNAAKTSGTCDQDVFVAGGTGQGTVLTSALVSGTAYTTLAVAALPVALNVGTGIVLTNGTNTQSVNCSAAAIGATSITVTSFTANANYGTGSAVLFGGWQSAIGATAYTVPAANFQGYGTHLHDNFFNRVRRVLVQNWASDVYLDTNEWWQQCGSNLAVTPSTLTSALVSGTAYTTLAVSALGAAVAAGDQIQIGTSSTGAVTAVSSQVVTASAVASAGATSVTVTSFTANANYAIGVKVFNSTSGIGAALEVYGCAGSVSLVNATANRFEMSGAYSYAIRLCGPAAFESTLSGNNMQDANAANIACFRFDIGAQYNTVMAGLINNGNVPMIDDQSSTYGTQLVMRPQVNQPSLFPQGIISQGLISKTTDGYGPQMLDASGNVVQERSNGSSLFINYTPAGGSLVQLLRATQTQLILGGTTAGQNYYVENNFGHLNLQCLAGDNIYFGDATFPHGVTVINSNISVTHLLAQGTAPTVATASASTSLSITGQDTAHNVLLTTAASIAAGSSVATVTFNLSYTARGPNTLPRFGVTPKNQASATAQPYITGDSATGYSVALANPPALATAMAFDVCVIGS